MKDEAQTSNDLVAIEPSAITAAYQANDLSPILTQIKDEVAKYTSDLTTAKGRQEVKSLAYKVVRSKTLLDAAGKDLTEEARKTVEAVNAQRRKVKEELDALAETVRQPLVEWQEAEDARKAKHEAGMKVFDLKATSHAMPAADIAAILAEVEAVKINAEWEEYEGPAAEAKEAAIAKIKSDLESAQVREAQEKQIAELKAAQEKQAEEAQKAAQIQAAKEAEEKAAKEAEEREAELDRQAEAIAQELAGRAIGVGQGVIGEKPQPYAILHFELTETIPKMKAETGRHWPIVLNAIADAKSALIDIKAAEDAKAEAEREEREAKRADEAAAQERQRLEEQARDKAAEDERKASNTRRRNRVLKDIADAVCQFQRDDIPQAILDGKIPHVKVEFS